MNEKFAVIATGGKQYIVEEGTKLDIEIIDNKKEGDKISFDKVLLVNNQGVKIGAPYVDGAKVEGEIINEKRAKKIRVIKFKSKTRYRRNYGHKQPLLGVKITSIN